MTARNHAAFAAICAVALGALAPAALARGIKLNDTGMTACMDKHANWSSECSKSNQDAAYGRDVNEADPDDGAVGFSFRKVCHSGQMAGEGTCPADPTLGSGPDDRGCTHDNVSGLTWELKTVDGGTHDGQRLYTNLGRKARDEISDIAWLVNATNAEALCGATNWRLPEAIELQSIVDYGIGAPGMAGPFHRSRLLPQHLGFQHLVRHRGCKPQGSLVG